MNDGYMLSGTKVLVELDKPTPTIQIYFDGLNGWSVTVPQAVEIWKQLASLLEDLGELN